jgi:hypothetical protein
MQTKRSSLQSNSTRLPDSPPRPSNSPSASTREAQSPPSSPAPHSLTVRTAGISISAPTAATTPSQHRTGQIADIVSHPQAADPPSTPVPCSSESVSGTLLAARPSTSRLPIPGAFLSPSIETPTHKPMYIPQIPQTEPRAEAVRNPYYRSMAPPPSPNLPPLPTPRPQPPDSDSIEPRPPSTTISAAISAPALPTSREEVDAAIVVAETKLSGRLVKRVFSRKGARPHIYQSLVGLSTLFLEHIFTAHIQHRARVSEVRKEDREALVKQLYEVERARGYSSDFQTYQGVKCCILP